MPSPPIVPILPSLLLLICVLVTLIAVLLATSARRRHARSLVELAREWRMQYSPRDILSLSDRVAAHLPTTGAADVRVRDVIYGTEPEGHRCIFCAEYTAGVIRSKSRRRCVISLLEPRGRSDASIWSTIKVAPDDLPLIEQYRAVSPINPPSK